MNSKLKNRIKKSPLFDSVERTRLFKFIHYCRFKRHRIQQNLNEAKSLFALEKPEHGNWDDYKRAFAKHLVSYSEYMYQYEFWHLNEEERNKYISRLEMRLLYERIVPLEVCKIFWNKADFLTRFSPFIHRQWAMAKDITYEDFQRILNSTDCIAKPIEGSLGQGIFKITKSSCSLALYEKCVAGNFLIEECIHNEPRIAQFHPSSLNTIRLTTVSGEGVLGTFIRTGIHGNIVDNAHAGGIFAQINPDTGMIESDGIDTNGHRYAEHPDTGVRFKGVVIPRWQELVETCQTAHRIMPEAPVVGWDICIDSNNNIELIEGNHLPDVDLLQSPLKRGIKAKVESMLRVKIK